MKYGINDNDIPLIKQEKELYDISDLIIKAVDSTYFEVISDNMELINKLKYKFMDVVEIN